MESCPVCAEDFQGLSKQKIHPHLKLHQEDVFCDKCGKNFPSASKLYQHYNIFHIKKAEVCCEQCGKSFSNEASLAKHKLNTHSAGVICESCDTKFSSKRNLMRHMRKWKIGFIWWSRPLKTNLIVTWPFSRQNQEFLKIQSSIKIRVKL